MKFAITDTHRIDELFLRYNKGRQGYIDIENLRDMCRKIQLFPNDDILKTVSLIRYINIYIYI